MTEGEKLLALECRDFVREQSGGEWSEKVEREDADKLLAFVRDKIARALGQERA
jgi:hypothetical protein